MTCRHPVLGVANLAHYVYLSFTAAAAASPATAAPALSSTATHATTRAVAVGSASAGRITRL